jgi:pyruvate dehydrogenase E2 component (dihydrolipoamide acetyltransferase)
VPIGTPLAVITDTADEEIPEVSSASPVRVPESPPPREVELEGARTGTPQFKLAERQEGNGFLSPVVRALLAEHGLSPGDVIGSGADGRITRADVLAVVANPPRAGAPLPAPAAAPATIAYPPAVPGPGDEVIEFSKARRNTAEHMLRSLATSAHTLVATEVDYRAIDGVRRPAALSFLPFVARAVVDAIAEFPHVNASVGNDVLIVHPHVHLGVAVDVDFQALVVPVVRDADGKRLRALADDIAGLADRARAKRLTADDLSGGTFTITNVGSYGTLVTGPVINQPQVAILSTDGVKMRPVAVKAPSGEWTIAVHPVGNLCLSFDHRAYDGAYASAFLARVREILETRDWSQEV